MLRTELIRPVPEVLEEKAERHGERVAFHDGSRAVSYADLELRTRRLAGHLAELRLQPGDRAAILMRNRVEMVESYFAITRASGIAVPLTVESTDEELAHVLHDSGARVVITDAGNAERVARASTRRLVVLVVGDDHVRTSAGSTLSYEARACTDSSAGARDDLSLDLPAWMLYTAGTTGLPKGVLSSQRNCLWSVAACYVPIAGLCDTDRVLWPLPLSHSLSHIACVLGVTSTGGTARIVERFAPEEVLRLAFEDGATVLAGLPSTYHQLVRAARRRTVRLPELRIGLVGGAITTGALRRDFADVFGVPLLDVYGSTETCGSITVNWPTSDRAGALPVPGLNVRLVDQETGLEAGTDQEGEVLVSGPGVMLGYHNQPESTAAVLRDGWYHTGDLARKDATGCITVVGRMKEQIIRAGERIHPGEIEAVVRDVPGVAGVAVVGKPHSVLGEVPVAFVVPGPDGFDPERVYAACRDRLPYFKQPVELYEIGSIPRTPLGKTTRHVLLDVPARLRAASTGSCDTLFRRDWVPLPSVPEHAPVTGRWSVEDERWAASLKVAGVRVVAPALADVVVRQRGPLAEITAGGRRTVVDLDDDSDPGVVLPRAVAAGEPRVSVRSSVLLVPRLGRTRLGSAPALDAASGTVVVTGAEHPLVAAVTRHLVAAHGVRDLLLIGSARHAGRAWSRLVADLREEGARVATAAGDAPPPRDVSLVVHGECLGDEAGADGARDLAALAGNARLVIFTEFDATAGTTPFDDLVDAGRAVLIAWADLPVREALATFDAALSFDRGHFAATRLDGGCWSGEVPPLLRDLVDSSSGAAQEPPCPHDWIRAASAEDVRCLAEFAEAGAPVPSTIVVQAGDQSVEDAWSREDSLAFTRLVRIDGAMSVDDAIATGKALQHGERAMAAESVRGEVERLMHELNRMVPDLDHVARSSVGARMRGLLELVEGVG
ncbi:AMP-binding protein [Lentzea tibetensis]|uniref:AMP-binding protein n=1 Tax=Lentzea tibetensis TaxID=2591470 RepID=UPI001C9A2867|nr:AMP-binding protein [Lentzea tibetensis]